MNLPVFRFLHRFLQHVLPRRFHTVRHHGFLSRRSNIDLEHLRTAVLKSLQDVEPDLELVEWTVPVLRATRDDGPTCPHCGERMEFVSFHRIRPPPLHWRVPVPA